MDMLTTQRRPIGWGFWLQWVLLMTVLLSLSYSGVDIVLRPIVTRAVPDPWLREAAIVLGLALLGVSWGTAQWLLLRPHVHGATRWGLATAATMWLGGSLAELAAFSGIAVGPSLALSFVLLGPVCGILQWVILRQQVVRAGWWVLVQTTGWLVVFAVASAVAVGAASLLGGPVDDYLPMSYAVGGAALGATTGTVLWWLLRPGTRR